MKIGFIGVGSMGRAIIPNLVRAGFPVSAWNRSAEAFSGLDAVTRLPTVADAFQEDLVITLLSDDHAVTQTLIDTQALRTAKPGTLHIVMSTLSPALVDRLQDLHAEAGVGFLAAPVFGIPAVAAQGQLNILAAGAADALERARPVFDVIGRKTWHLGDRPSLASIAKLGGNLMITQAIQSLGEAMSLVETHGLAPADFVDLVTQTLFACPSYQRYGSKIASGDLEPGFKLTLGLKDVNLALAAAESKGQALPAAERVRQTMQRAIDQGLGDRDWSAMAQAIRTHAPQPAAAPSGPWEAAAPRTLRRGHLWISGDRVEKDGLTYQAGPMYVAWEAPVHVTRHYPVVLVHGGTLQGTEWHDTPDGRPGWAQRFVEAGYAVFCVDRPGHGRSPYHPDTLGEMGPPFSYERGKQVYFPEGGAETQWPFDPDDADAYDAFIGAYGPMPADLARSQTLDADRLTRLLDRIGPAIVVTHSASGPDGWLLADRRPDRVAAIVAVEPMGPAFGHTPGIGTLNWGLTAAPLTFDPPRASADEVRQADPESLVVPALRDIPIALLTGETSIFASYAPSMLTFLRNAGAQPEHLDLPAMGIHGNGHGLIYERNSDAIFQVVQRWLERLET